MHWSLWLSLLISTSLGLNLCGVIPSILPTATPIPQNTPTPIVVVVTATPSPTTTRLPTVTPTPLPPTATATPLPSPTSTAWPTPVVWIPLPLPLQPAPEQWSYLPLVDMILDYYGESYSPEYLWNISIEAARIAGRFDQKFHLESHAVYYQDVIEALQPLGYSWQQDCRAIEGEDFNQRTQQLQGSLQAGRPVLLGMYDEELGYPVALVGYDPARREYTYFQLTQVSNVLMQQTKTYYQPERVSISEATLSQMWREAVTEGTERCAVFTSPKP